jgi:hypothetical protein
MMLQRSRTDGNVASVIKGAAGNWRLWLPPILAYLLSHLIQAAGPWRTGQTYFGFEARSRFDSALYMQIAEEGPTLALCRDLGIHLESPEGWCGTAGWFPLYPGLIRLVEVLSPFDTIQSGLLVAEAATLVVFGLFWWLLQRLPGGGWVGRVALLGLLAAFPSGTYLHAVFPLSLTIAATLGHVALLRAGRPLAAGLVGAVAAASYPIAAGIIVIGLVVVALDPARNVRNLLAGVLPVLGTLAVFVVHAVTTGHWDAYFLIQQRYEAQGEGKNPVHNLLTLLRDAPRVPYTPDNPPSPSMVERWQQVAPAEMAFAALLTLLVTAVALWPLLKRHRPDPLDAGLALYTLAMFGAPLVVGTQISQYRAHLLLVPGLLVLRRLPAVVVCALAVAALPLAYWMGMMFGPRILF